MRQTLNVNGACGKVMCVADLIGHPGATPYGAQLYTTATATGHVAVGGSWAVTAP